MNTELLNQCAPRIINVPTDGSIARADIIPLTPQRFAALYNQSPNDQQLYRAMTEARMAGVRTSGIYDLFFGPGRTSLIGKTGNLQIGANTIRLPYIMLYQRDHINAGAWRVYGGSATPNAGSGSVPVHSWDLLLRVTSSRFASALESLERYFLPESTLIVSHTLADGTLNRVQFRVVASVNDDQSDGISTISQAKVTVVPTGITVTDWGTATDDEKAVYHPTTGVAMNGANAVSDWQSYCYNHTAERSGRLLHFWTQRSRYTRIMTDLTAQWLKMIWSSNTPNDVIAKYMELPTTEADAQARAKYDREQMTTFLFGEKEPWQDPNTFYQTTEGRVYDATWGEFTGEYNTRTEGVFTLLGKCNRVVDMAGGPLDVNSISDYVWQLARSRANSTINTGKNTVPCIVDDETSLILRKAMIAWYKFQGLDPAVYIKEGEKLAFGDRYNWTTNTYMLPGTSTKLEVNAEPALSDYAAEFTGVSQTAGHMMLFLDPTDIKVAKGNTGHRVSENPKIESTPALACVMKANVKRAQMLSEQFTVKVEDPDRSLIIQNFDVAACPIIRDRKCSVTELS